MVNRAWAGVPPAGLGTHAEADFGGGGGRAPVQWLRGPILKDRELLEAVPHRHLPRTHQSRTIGGVHLYGNPLPS